MYCTRCQATGFLNFEQVPDTLQGWCEEVDDYAHVILAWVNGVENHDVSVCDCCGDGEEWYGTPGEHYTADDPQGDDGPYARNGGLCQCH